MVRYRVTLSREDRERLSGFSVDKENEVLNKYLVLHAQILVASDTGEFQTGSSTNEEIARVLDISERTVERVKKKFVEEGLEAALYRKKPDREYFRKIDGDLEARLIALSCGPAPEGYKRWSLRLLADKAVELELIDSISHVAVRKALKKRA